MSELPMNEETSINLEGVSDAETANLNKKSTSRGSINLASTLSRATTATVDLIGGLADAVAQGFRTYGEKIDADSISRFSLDNGMVDAALDSWSTFFDTLSVTMRRVRDDLPAPVESLRNSFSDAELRNNTQIDYRLLARLVAEELREQGSPRKAVGGIPPDPAAG